MTIPPPQSPDAPLSTERIAKLQERLAAYHAGADSSVQLWLVEHAGALLSTAAEHARMAAALAAAEARVATLTEALEDIAKKPQHPGTFQGHSTKSLWLWIDEAQATARAALSPAAAGREGG